MHEQIFPFSRILISIFSLAVWHQHINELASNGQLKSNGCGLFNGWFLAVILIHFFGFEHVSKKRDGWLARTGISIRYSLIWKQDVQFKCVFCPKSFQNTSLLEEHIPKDHPTGKGICMICAKTLSWQKMHRSFLA